MSDETEWGRLKAHELRGLADRNAILIVPIGATEQHGPHLPVMVDYRLAHEVAVLASRLIAEQQPVVVAPVIPYGMSEHHVSLGGTLTLDFADHAGRAQLHLRQRDPPGVPADLHPQRPWREYRRPRDDRHGADDPAPAADRLRRLLADR